MTVALSAAGAHAGPAHSAKSCATPRYPGSGYFTSLTVTNVTCASGRKLALAYYRCRTKHGKKGRCSSPVLGYSCTEKRTSIPTEFDARVTCRSGHKRIVHTYQQNT